MKRIVLSLLIVLGVFTGATAQKANMDARKLQLALFAISNLYVDSTSETKLVEDAIVGMLDKLDPHSNYMDPEETKEMTEPLQGNFDGIGIQFNMLTDTLYVIQVIPGGPSEKVGLMAGDRIIQVDDTLIAGVKMKTTDIMKKLRGPKGTEVRVKVKRGKSPELMDFKIVRGKIPVYSLDAAYMADKNTGYIKLNRFAASSADEFREALEKLRKQGMKNLILDLQGNGGGYLNIAIELADEFLDKNRLIVYTKGSKQPREEANSTARGQFQEGRLVVLVDESSASASEIVSGAIQDWDRGVIVGRRTFGKGLVQKPIPLPDGSMIQDRDSLTVPSTRRNPVLADVFNRLGYMERKGSGFGKIISGYEFQINYNESKRPSFRSDRYQFTVVMPNLNYDVPQDFEGNETMSESMSKSMSELEKTRMQTVLQYLDTNKEIDSSIAAELLKVEIKTASRLLLKAEKLDILKSYGKTKNKVYFRE